MAIVHRAELRPSKLELLGSWLPTQDWCDATGEIARESVFRLDDPAGEVGIEVFLIRCGDALFHVPLTYRGAPLDSGTLVGEMDHSVLGPRWVYDGPSDPVYRDVVTTTIVEGGRDVDMVLDDGTPVPRLEWWATAVGSGADPEAAGRSLTIARRLPVAPAPTRATLSATWLGQDTPLVLAWL